jgi:hypothetical protein
VPDSSEPIFANLWIYLGRSLWDLRSKCPFDAHVRIMKVPEQSRLEEFDACFHEYLEGAGKLIRECCARCCDRILGLPRGALSENLTDNIQDAIEKKIGHVSDYTRRWVWRTCEGPSSFDVDLSELPKAHLQWTAPAWLIEKQLSNLLKWEEPNPDSELNRIALDRLEADLRQRTTLRLRDGVLGDELLLLRSAEEVNRLGSSPQAQKPARPDKRRAATEMREKIRVAVKTLRTQGLTYEQMMRELDRLGIPVPGHVSWFDDAAPDMARTWVNGWHLNDRKGDSKPISQYLGGLIREAEAQEGITP